MSSKFVEQIRQHAPGTLQNRLTSLIVDLPAQQGGELLEQARMIGDHTAGLTTALSTLGLVRLDHSMPKFGRASEYVRKGTTLVFEADSGVIQKVPVILEPGKSRLHNS